MLFTPTLLVKIEFTAMRRMLNNTINAKWRLGGKKTLLRLLFRLLSHYTGYLSLILEKDQV